MSTLEAAFERELYDTYHQAAAKGYRATYFFQMLGRYGGMGTAQRLLAAAEVAEGLMKLWELNQLHISVEAIVLKPEYATLFTDGERAQARQRLAALNYKAPWDRGE
jgi:hypothetical protein